MSVSEAQKPEKDQPQETLLRQSALCDVTTGTDASPSLQGSSFSPSHSQEKLLQKDLVDNWMELNVSEPMWMMSG